MRGIETLVSALKGRFQKGGAVPDAHASGLPRGWRAAAAVEFADADGAAAVEWTRDPTPDLPRVRRRSRAKRRGGSVAVLRDISASMFGERSKWASSVVLRLVDGVAREQRLRVGYSEFNDETFRLSLSDADGGSASAKAVAERKSLRKCVYTGEPVSAHADDFSLAQRALARAKAVRERGPEALAGVRGGALPDALTRAKRRAAVRYFSRDYDGIAEHAANLWVDGMTNYQGVLGDALEMFDEAAKLGLAGGRHVVMLTDGHPTHGSKTLVRERRRAKALGVAIHAIFIGAGAYPPILATLARETGGAIFQAVPDEDHAGLLHIVDLGREAESRPVRAQLN